MKQSSDGIRYITKFFNDSYLKLRIVNSRPGHNYDFYNYAHHINLKLGARLENYTHCD